jgi:cytidylate kinase
MIIRILILEIKIIINRMSKLKINFNYKIFLKVVLKVKYNRVNNKETIGLSKEKVKFKE